VYKLWITCALLVPMFVSAEEFTDPTQPVWVKWNTVTDTEFIRIRDTWDDGAVYYQTSIITSGTYIRQGAHVVDDAYEDAAFVPETDVWYKFDFDETGGFFYMYIDDVEYASVQQDDGNFETLNLFCGSATSSQTECTNEQPAEETPVAETATSTLIHSGDLSFGMATVIYFMATIFFGLIFNSFKLT